MTQEAQRIAIGGAIEERGGIKHHLPTEEEIKTGSYYQYWPDYPRSLDAMHEAEKVLTSVQLYTYQGCLMKVCDENNTLYFKATAAQRAEAFLRTLNLWDDTK